MIKRKLFQNILNIALRTSINGWGVYKFLTAPILQGKKPLNFGSTAPPRGDEMQRKCFTFKISG